MRKKNMRMNKIGTIKAQSMIRVHGISQQLCAFRFQPVVTGELQRALRALMLDSNYCDL